MKIIVFVKQVPVLDATPRVAPDEKAWDETGLTFQTNGPDAYALEAGLQLRDRFGGEVLVVSLGPERAKQTLKESLAKGAERGLHIHVPHAHSIDSFDVARTLAAAARPESADLLLTGLQSEDLCSGQTGVLVAELLGIAHATIVTEIEPAADSVRVRRELENGWTQYVTLPLPAVLTIQSGTQKLRLATMLGIKQAKTKELRVVTLEDLGIKPVSPPLVDRIYPPVRQKRAEMLTGDPRECARQLVEQLRRQARIS